MNQSKLLLYNTLTHSDHPCAPAQHASVFYHSGSPLHGDSKKLFIHSVKLATLAPRLPGGLPRLLWLLRLLAGAQVRLLLSVAQRGPKSHQLREYPFVQLEMEEGIIMKFKYTSYDRTCTGGGSVVVVPPRNVGA